MTTRACIMLLAAVIGACSFEHGIPGNSGNPEAGSSPPEGGAGGAEGGLVNPEAGSACTAGATCDDMNACTELDTCVSGQCRGIDDQCPANCASSCVACGGDTCCHETCLSGSTCPTCPTGCSCDLSCGTSRPCSPTCSTGASCKFAGTNNETDGNYAVTCQTGSSCVVDCVGDQGTCTVTCQGDAACLVIDSMQAASTTLVCPTTAITCPSPNQNIKVCNRPCP